jgi:hypothetical protein
MAIRDRLRSHGCWAMGPLDHGFCKSIYLAAPEGIMLELATSEGKPIDAEAWIESERRRRSPVRHDVGADKCHEVTASGKS